jgi:hypothetical protein
VTRVFLDANVLFLAAWRSDSGLTRLRQIASLHLVTLPCAADEAERNLARKRSEGVAPHGARRRRAGHSRGRAEGARDGGRAAESRRPAPSVGPTGGVTGALAAA